MKNLKTLKIWKFQSVGHSDAESITEEMEWPTFCMHTNPINLLDLSLGFS